MGLCTSVDKINKQDIPVAIPFMVDDENKVEQTIDYNSVNCILLPSLLPPVETYFDHVERRKVSIDKQNLDDYNRVMLLLETEYIDHLITNIPIYVNKGFKNFRFTFKVNVNGDFKYSEYYNSGKLERKAMVLLLERVDNPYIKPFGYKFKYSIRCYTSCFNDEELHINTGVTF